MKSRVFLAISLSLAMLFILPAVAPQYAYAACGPEWNKEGTCGPPSAETCSDCCCADSGDPPCDRPCGECFECGQCAASASGEMILTVADANSGEIITKNCGFPIVASAYAAEGEVGSPPPETTVQGPRSLFKPAEDTGQWLLDNPLVVLIGFVLAAAGALIWLLVERKRIIFKY